MAGRYVFTLRGCFKPYVRMTRRSKWVDEQAGEYLASKDDIRTQLNQQMRRQKLEMLPPQTPLCAHITVEHNHGWHNRDADNMLKAVLDAAQGIVFKDDRWVDSVQIVRREGPCCQIGLAVGLN